LCCRGSLCHLQSTTAFRCCNPAVTELLYTVTNPTHCLNPKEPNRHPNPLRTASAAPECRAPARRSVVTGSCAPLPCDRPVPPLRGQLLTYAARCSAVSGAPGAEAEATTSGGLRSNTIRAPA